jgi:hypothetical protein
MISRSSTLVAMKADVPTKIISTVELKTVEQTPEGWGFASLWVRFHEWLPGMVRWFCVD